MQLEKIPAILERYGMVFLEGLGGTLWFSLISVAFAVFFGTILAVMRLSRVKLFEGFVDVYLWIIRGTPILLQLYFFWLGLPRLLHMELSNETCIVAALIINASAYVCEVIRAGIQAVDSGQTEAAKSLGMSDFNAMTRIILPQAIKNILPALGNEFIVMVKQTSLASVFFVHELMTAQKTVQSATFQPMPSLIIAGLIYLAVTTVLTFCLRFFERRLHKSERSIV
ncbi:MAG: amino acid ABC transporter permease [Christensenellaceae bacterium]|nr:amino acid ABC transporter permease [Christensenellaceae bacterium]